MMIEDLYTPFSAQKQAEYEDWLVRTYDPEMAQQIAQARAHAVEAGPDFAEDGAKRLREIEAALVLDYEGGKPPEQADLSSHQAWVADIWGRPCDDQAYAQLSDIYMAHPISSRVSKPCLKVSANGCGRRCCPGQTGHNAV